MASGDKTVALMKHQDGSWNIGGLNSGLDADLIRGIPADFTNDLNGNGYQKLPGGLIIQWGKQHSSSDGNGNAGFLLPITFPNNCLQVVCNNSSNDSNIILNPYSFIQNKFFCNLKNPDGSVAGNTGVDCRFIAIGN